MFRSLMMLAFVAGMAVAAPALGQTTLVALSNVQGDLGTKLDGKSCLGLWRADRLAGSENDNGAFKVTFAVTNGALTATLIREKNVTKLSDAKFVNSKVEKLTAVRVNGTQVSWRTEAGAWSGVIAPQGGAITIASGRIVPDNRNWSEAAMMGDGGGALRCQ